MSAINRLVNDVHQGDAVEVLRELPESSAHMAMCSPPYFGLRDYGVDGQIGLEETLDEYIDSLVEVAGELRRVLRDDGSWWLNIGDSFARSGGPQVQDPSRSENPHVPEEGRDRRSSSFGRKQKLLVPHRVAMGLQDAGWVVRSDAVWSKPNPMPDPVQDRLNEHKEFVFHLTPAPDYWFDLDAIREEHAEASLERSGRHDHTHRDYPGANPQTLDPDQFVHPNGKNPGDIFEVTVKPFPDAHFAVYPPELCEKPIKSSCPPTVCAGCGTPYERDPEREDAGWSQTCDCETDETKPGIVLDPFAGAGTTLLVAKELGRRFVGIDLNEKFVAMAQKRVGITVDQPELLLDDENQSTLVQTDGGGNSRSVSTDMDRSGGGE